MRVLAIGVSGALIMSFGMRAASAAPVNAAGDLGQPQVVEPPAGGTGWGFGANAGLLVQGAVGPELRPGFSLEAHTSFESGRALSPLFALAYGWAQTGRLETSVGSVAFDWWTLRASVCPARWPETGRLALRGCGFYDHGKLRAAGYQIAQPSLARTTWVAVGATARLDATPVNGLGLIAEAGLIAPLSRDRFVFAPNTVVFEVPALATVGRLAVGGRFQ